MQQIASTERRGISNDYVPTAELREPNKTFTRPWYHIRRCLVQLKPFITILSLPKNLMFITLVAALLTILLVTSNPARAKWTDPAIDGTIKKIHVDQLGRVFIVGEFNAVDGVPAKNVAMWNKGQWHPLGSGTDGIVKDIDVANDGRVFIGGDFRNAGGVWVNHIAVWNGKSWQALGIGTNRSVARVQWVNSEGLFVFGYFTIAGGEIVNSVAIWDDSRWLPAAKVQKMVPVAINRLVHAAFLNPPAGAQ